MTFSPDAQSIYYPISEKGTGNLVRQSLSGGDPVPVTDFSDMSIYGFSYDWTNRRLAVARGRDHADVVLIKDQKAE